MMDMDKHIVIKYVTICTICIRMCLSAINEKIRIEKRGNFHTEKIHENSI